MKKTSETSHLIIMVYTLLTNEQDILCVCYAAAIAAKIIWSWSKLSSALQPKRIGKLPCEYIFAEKEHFQWRTKYLYAKLEKKIKNRKQQTLKLRAARYYKRPSTPFIVSMMVLFGCFRFSSFGTSFQKQILNALNFPLFALHFCTAVSQRMAEKMHIKERPHFLMLLVATDIIVMTSSWHATTACF